MECCSDDKRQQWQHYVVKFIVKGEGGRGGGGKPKSWQKSVDLSVYSTYIQEACLFFNDPNLYASSKVTVSSDLGLSPHAKFH